MNLLTNMLISKLNQNIICLVINLFLNITYYDRLCHAYVVQAGRILVTIISPLIEFKLPVNNTF
jgi:hypothetical protein